MDADYDGRQVVGIDLHRRRSVIARMTEAAERLGWVRIDNDPMAHGAPVAVAGGAGRAGGDPGPAVGDRGSAHLGPAGRGRRPGGARALGG
jgi:hypothetical protein